MIVRKLSIILSLIFALNLILIASCSDDEEKGDYSTVSNMIADRNKARFNRAAKESSSKKHTENDDELFSEEIPDKITEKTKTSGMLFEEDVNIISESTGKKIGSGTAYLDKSGKIINIRIKTK